MPSNRYTLENVLADPALLDEIFGPPTDPFALPRLVDQAIARRLGMSGASVQRRVRAGRWERILPGIYLTKPPCTRSDRLIAATMHGGPSSVISGAAALFDYGFRYVPEPRKALLLVPIRSGVTSTGFVTVRRTARLPQAELRPGPRLAPPARAVADHVLTLRDLDAVAAVVAQAVQRRFCTVADLGAELLAGPRRGSALFRMALADAGFGAASAPEATAGRILRRGGVTGFVQNAPVRAAGRDLVVDFLWPDLRAVLEIDSVDFHYSREEWHATMERDGWLQSAGFTTLHRTPSKLRAPDAFLADVTGWLAARSDELAR